MNKLKQWMYYVIIFTISFLTLAFLPMLGTEVNLGWAVPNTTVGWIVWGVVKFAVAFINVLIFHCFMMQGKLNVVNNPNFIKAREILMHTKKKEVKPRSPKQFYAKEYLSKGSSIFLSSAASTVAMTQAILTYDYLAMLTYLFVIIMGVVMGLLQMKKAEEYWTNEYYEYALLKKEDEEKCLNTTEKPSEH